MEPEFGSSNRLSRYSGLVTDRPSVSDAGAHRVEGIFALAGPAAARQEGLSSLGIVDVAPTVLHLLGLPVPDDMDGRVALEALTADFVARRPPQRSDAKPSWLEHDQTAGAAPADETDWKVRERLRALGYVE
jgi:arylsulfatase A-like enzyme